MPQYSRADILNQNTNDFPNNNSGQITPAILRDYNANVANSVVFIGEPVSSSVSASYAATASLAHTASFAINAAAAATATTASYAIQAQNAVNANTANYATTAGSASYADTASVAISTDSASFAQTAISSSYSNNSTSASYALTASFALNAPTINTGSFVTTSSFNAYTASTNTFTQSIQTQVNNLQAATSSYITSAQTSSMSVLSASYAVTASYVAGAQAFPYTGSANISGSLNLVGDAALYTGSIWLENNQTGSGRFYLKSVVTESYESGIKNNIWFDRSYDNTFTGSQVSSIQIIGNSNIINPGNLEFDSSLFPKVGFTGIGNYVTYLPYFDASADSIVTGSGIISLNNSLLANSIAFRPKLSTTNLTILNSYQGRVTTISATGSVSFNNINNQSLLTINNIANNSLTLTSVYLAGTNAISTVSSSFNANIQNSFLTNVTAYISSSATGNGIYGVGAFGTGLIVSASGVSTTTSGMGIVGTYNAADGVTDNVRQTRFLVGTGTSTGARRTSLHVSASGLTTISTGLTVSGSFNVANGITGSLLGTASYANNATSASYANNSTSASYALDATTASFASTIASGLNITASNILVNNNLVVNGTASFAYTKTVTGSAVIVGDAFIILNADTPTQPYAGIMVYDTGSVNATASLEWNGNNDYWITVEETGASAGILTGASGSKGSEVFPSANRLIKGTGNNTVVDSNITDSGTSVSINSNTSVTGSLNVSAGITGSLLGTASYSINADSASFAQTASFYGGTVVSASYALNSTSASYAQTATSASYATNSTSASYAATASYLEGSVVSASYAATASSADAFNIRLSLTASGLRYPTADGVQEQFLSTDGAGNLSFENVRTLYQNIRNRETSSIVLGTPLFVSGSTGDNADVYIADASNPARMPATLIAGDNTLAPSATGRAIILGHIEGVNTTGYPAGTLVYVGVGGSWTATAPTGSAQVQPLGVVTREGNNGMGIVLTVPPNSLPNIQAGYTWVGDANGVPQAVSTSSLLVTSASYATNSTSASFAQTAISASYAPDTTFPYTGSAAISGSLTLVGDQFVTGSITVRPTTVTGAQPFAVIEATDGTGFEGNLIMFRNTNASQTGSVNISGSTNIFMPSMGVSNATIGGGGAAGWFGRSSVVTTAAITITGSLGSGYARQYPSIVNSVVNTGIAITDNRPAGTVTSPLALSQVAVNGTSTTLTISTGSITLGGNNMVGTTVINVTGSVGASKTLSNSVIGTATINIDSTSGTQLTNAVVLGTGVSLLLSGSSNGTLQNVLIAGNTLSVTGSAGATANYGSAYVGRFNETGSTALATNTAFAVGTGTSATARKTSLHVSSSGLVTLTDGLTVTGSLVATSFTGSLLGTASFATSASYSLTSTSASFASNSTSASYALTASYAANAGSGGVAAGDIYSYTFLLMGA